MTTVQQNYSACTDKKFENLLLEAVDESLSSLGNSAKQAIYFHLEESFKLKRGEIPNRIMDFTTAIESIFGDGAKLLEIWIMKRLHEKVGQESAQHTEKDELFFAEYIQARANATI